MALLHHIKKRHRIALVAYKITAQHTRNVVMVAAKEVIRSKPSVVCYLPGASDQDINESLVLNASFDQLVNMFNLLGRQLSEKIQTAKSQACIAGLFSQFYYHPIMVRAQSVAQQSTIARTQLFDAFRLGCKPIYDIAGMWAQSLSKPYGNPGDFSLLESIYDGVPHLSSSSALGRALDLWGFTTELPRAVIDRKNSLKIFLEDFSQRRKSTHRSGKVLSIASGAARELREIPVENMSHLEITLLDLDARALDFADRFFATRPTSYSINRVVGNALSQDVVQQLEPYGPFDLAYSFGLYDYLTDKHLLKSISIAKSMLVEDGTFVFCLKDHRYYDAWFYNLLFDWRFVPRTIEDGKALCEKAGLNLKEIFVVEGRAVCIYVCSVK